MNPLVLLDNCRRGESHWLISGLEHFVLALATSWRCQVLLYARVSVVAQCAFKTWQELLYFNM
jgi:hypothetical protein